MSIILRPFCLITGHSYEVFRENDTKIILKCSFCEKIKTIIK